MQEIIKVCSDIRTMRLHLAKKHRISSRKIDFEILGINTFLVRGKDDLQRVSNRELHEIAYTPYSMRQFYKVRFFARDRRVLDPFVISLESSEEGSMLEAILSLERLPAPDNQFVPTLQLLIYKQMILQGYILGLGGKIFQEELARFFTTLKKDPRSFKDSARLLICKLRAPEIIKPYSLKLLSRPYAQGKLQEDSELLEGAILKVKQGEALLSYRKPTYRVPWRNVRGEWFGEGDYPIGIACGEGLERTEDEETITYKANQDGFASIVEKKLNVLEAPLVKSVDFKLSQQIAPLEIKRLQISNDDNTSDAVAQGVELAIPTLLVKGNVGPATKLHAEELRINGQIHARAVLHAHDAKLLFLKGSLTAQDAQVKFCEGANIKTKHLKTSYLGGTTAFFEEGQAERLGSNNTLHVSTSLRIGRVLGKTNTIYFDPLASQENERLFASLKEQQDFLENVVRGEYWREKEIEYESTGMRIFLEELEKRKNIGTQASLEAVAQSFEEARRDKHRQLALRERILKALEGSKERLLKINKEILALKERVLEITFRCDGGIGGDNRLMFALPEGLLEFIPPYEVRLVRLVRDEKQGYAVRYEV
ncbi:MAG: hypothetical protein ACTTH5_05770 [Wolinella sp.]